MISLILQFNYAFGRPLDTHNAYCLRKKKSHLHQPRCVTLPYTRPMHLRDLQRSPQTAVTLYINLHELSVSTLYNPKHINSLRLRANNSTNSIRYFFFSFIFKKNRKEQ
jgi:hypothetical protein